MAKTTFADLFESEAVILADGGMGTMLMAAGLQPGDSPELWNVEHADEVRSIHRGYLAAGAQIILTNTFGGNQRRLMHRQLERRAVELNQAAAVLARAEVDALDRRVVVGGSIGPTGVLMAPLGDLTYDEAAGIFEEQAGALVAGGVDVLWVETMSDLQELRAAVEGCRKVAADFPIVATMTFDSHGHTSMGVAPEAAVEAFGTMELLAFGGNCGNGPEEIEGVIESMHTLAPEAVLIAKSNAGLPKMVDGQQVYDATPEVMAEHARRVRDLGARIIGACCGSTPAHIQAMGQALKG
ncbi:MAG TPA: methionine synthase [Anaerolineae bacterium]|nr:methionine synthase [Anaerolineae bacterium]